MSELSHMPINLRSYKAKSELPYIPPFTPKPESYNVPEYLYRCPMDAKAYSIIRDNFTKIKNIPVTHAHFIEAKNFTENLLGKGLLDNVSYSIIPIELWDNGDTSEAFSLACGEDEHHIYIPSEFSSPVELFCHELGHAAHYTARRRSKKYSSLFQNTMTTELVAHYVQYNYILKSLPKVYFMAAIPQIVHSAYAHTIMQHGITEGCGKFTDYETFFKSEISREIRAGWWEDALERVYPEFAENIPHTQEYFKRNVAMTFALLLLNEHDGMRRFIYSDDGEKSVTQLLKECFPSLDMESGWNEFSRHIESLFVGV